MRDRGVARATNPQRSRDGQGMTRGSHPPTSLSALCGGWLCSSAQRHHRASETEGVKATGASCPQPPAVYSDRCSSTCPQFDARERGCNPLDFSRIEWTTWSGSPQNDPWIISQRWNWRERTWTTPNRQPASHRLCFSLSWPADSGPGDQPRLDGAGRHLEGTRAVPEGQGLVSAIQCPRTGLGR